MEKERTVRMTRKEAAPVGSMLGYWVRAMGLSDGFNERIICKAWDNVTGAGSLTLNKYVRDRVLHCQMASSMVRSQLLMQKDMIIKAINEEIVKDPLFTTSTRRPCTITGIVLR